MGMRANAGAFKSPHAKGIRNTAFQATLPQFQCFSVMPLCGSSSTEPKRDNVSDTEANPLVRCRPTGIFRARKKVSIVGALLAFGFTQLRRHWLLALITSGVPVAVWAAIYLIFLEPSSGQNPEDIWHTFSVTQKLLVFAGFSLVTWIPFVTNQVALAIAIDAEQRGTFLSPSALARRAFGPTVAVAVGWYPLWYVSVGIIGFIVGLLLAFLPTIRALEGPRKRIARDSVKLCGGTVLALWIVVPIVLLVVLGVGGLTLIGDLQLGHRPILNSAWIVFVTVIGQTVLNSALVKIYLDDRSAHCPKAAAPVLPSPA